jgi:DDE superfamily endonuclease
VEHQYCGQLGKQANCQVAVTLSIANRHASLPIAYRLYLPQTWAKDRKRRDKARVPKKIKFKTKPQIALEQMQEACAAGVPRGVALMDASYGTNSALRAGISALGLSYVAGIVPTIKVRTVSKRGVLLKRRSVKNLALSLPKHAWRTITWREGTNDQLCSRFARVRVHASPTRGRRGQPEETLLIEWPEGRARTHQILALNARQEYVIPAAGGYGKNALADRARLSGPQAGNRSRSLRGPRVAWFSSSRHTVYRSLWVPDLRTGDDSPLRTSFRQESQKICHSQ